MEKIERISNHAYVHKSANVLITFAQSDRSPEGKIAKVGAMKSGDYEIKRWGSDNLTPNVHEQILLDNNIVPSLMITKRDIIIGNGIQPYVEVIEGDGAKAAKYKIPVAMPSVVDEWIDKSEFNEKYLQVAANEMLKHENIFAGLMPTKGGKLHDVKAYECKHIRAVKKNKDGHIPGYIHFGNWAKPRSQEHKYVHIPSYGSGARRLSMLHFGDNFLNDGYYNAAPWTGGIEWVELANIIPKFHKSNLINIYSTPFHIKIPADYFLDVDAYNAASDMDKVNYVDAAKLKKKEFITDLNNMLAGYENAGRVINSTKAFDPISKKYEGIDIEEIKINMNDDKLLKLFDKSNDANVAAQGLPHSLSNTQQGMKLSVGSEIRNAFNIYVAIKTLSYRRQLLRPWKVVCEINGWDKLQDKGRKIKWGFEDIKLEKLDDDKSGVSQPQIM